MVLVADALIVVSGSLRSARPLPRFLHPLIVSQYTHIPSQPEFFPIISHGVSRERKTPVKSAHICFLERGRFSPELTEAAPLQVLQLSLTSQETSVTSIGLTLIDWIASYRQPPHVAACSWGSSIMRLSSTLIVGQIHQAALTGYFADSLMWIFIWPCHIDKPVDLLIYLDPSLTPRHFACHGLISESFITNRCLRTRRRLHHPNWVIRA
ncbi:hypothetical protein IG631_04222 [Alternaria alternata]|nr:hypothetical protein IG631_04222 [Alternaria alternata]